MSKIVLSWAQWYTPVIPVVCKAEAGGLPDQSQLQQWQGTKQLNETLSLNKIQNRTGNVVQWLSAPELNPWYPPPNKKD